MFMLRVWRFTFSASLLFLLLVSVFCIAPSPVFAAPSNFRALGSLELGERVFDPTWEWEHRLGDHYSGSGEVQPVMWIVAAKNHYGAGSGITLVSEALIGRFTFDNSSDRGNFEGSNHWGDSGTGNATRGLRPWLNSSGIHQNEGFYRAFSDSFKSRVIAVTIPNKAWQDGRPYTTTDRVFIPTTTELGATHSWFTHEIGLVYPYFDGLTHEERKAELPGDDVRESWGNVFWWYWTRSPDKQGPGDLRYVFFDGFGSLEGIGANDGRVPVRPAVNLSSDTLVKAVDGEEGLYEILSEEGLYFGDINRDGKINVQDVTLVMRYTLEMQTLTADQIKRADVNLDGEVNVIDASLIMRKALGLIEQFH